MEILIHPLLKHFMVAILPGESFGEDPSRLTARLAFVDFDGSEALKAIYQKKSVDKEFLKTYCPAIMDGIAALCEGLQSL